MASLFQGTPQTATQTSTNTTATPNWLQDAIYNQVQMSQNVAATPFTPYGGQLTAGLSPLQQQAQQAATSSVGTWQKPYGEVMSGLQAAGEQGAGGAAAAQPYLNQGSRAAYMDVNNYLNPYNTNVTDRIAQLGARNLSENLLPGVSDQFIKAGQFGGSRMGEFGSRALRDTQESVLGQQGALLQQGYGQSLNAAQADADRQVAIARAAADQANADAQFRQSGLAQQASLLQQGQQMRGQDIDRLNALGTQQQGLNQAGLTSAYNQYLMEQGYPQQQVQFATEQLRGLSPLVTGVTQNTQTSTGNTGLSPLSQVGAIGSLAGGLFGDKGPLSGVASGIGNAIGGGLSSAFGDYAGNWLSSLVGYADGGLVEGDEDEETSTPDDYLQQALARYGVSAPDYSGQSKAAQQRVSDERARLQDMIRAAGETRTAGPSQSELFFKLASAFGTPGKTGSFFEQVGNAGGVLAENQQQMRANEAANAERAQQFGFEVQKLGLKSAEDELKAIRSAQLGGAQFGQTVKLEDGNVYQLRKNGPPVYVGKAPPDAPKALGGYLVENGELGAPIPMTPQEQSAEARANARFNADQTYGPIPAGYERKPDGSVSKMRGYDGSKAGAPMSSPVIKQMTEARESLRAAESMEKNLAAAKILITGDSVSSPIRMGPYAQLEAKARDWYGAGDENSRKLNELKRVKEKARGDYMLLAKGAQTEGDAVRAMDAIMPPSNDPEVILNQLEALKRQSDLMTAIHGETIAAINQEYGREPESGLLKPQAGSDPRQPAAKSSAPRPTSRADLDMIVPVASREEALALPSGTRFRTPDGRIKVAP